MFVRHNQRPGRKAWAVALGTLACTTVFAAAYAGQAAVRSGSLPNPGKPVFDTRIQPLAEDAVKKGMALHGASAGFAIVADPTRGTVLAAVSLNDGFDPALKGDWALSYLVEPGSALKPLIVGAALQGNTTVIDERHDCENGEYDFGNMIIRDAEPFAFLSTAEAVIHSSNICTVKVAQRLGARGIVSALRDFGIGKNGSAVDFPAASPGHVPDAGVIPDDNYLALVSQGISNRTGFYLTPLELVEAYGAIANGGRLMKAIGLGAHQAPHVIRDVLSPDVAAQMRDILRRVVTEGTGSKIKGSPIPLAGKTSTALINGSQRVTGFIGYAPADQPKVVIYVVLIDPKGKDKFGSNTSAPVFREIAERVVPIL